MRRLRGLSVALLALFLATGSAPIPQEGQTTGDPSNVSITQLHIFMSRVGDQLQVGEYYQVSNSGEQTYVGVADPATGQRATLVFTLPDEAENLDFNGPGLGERFLELAEGFADTEPVPPGVQTVEVSFSYLLPYQEMLSVERVFSVPVDSVALIFPLGEMVLEGPGLISAGVFETQAGPALSYVAGPLAAGEPLVFTLVPGEPPPMSESPAVPIATEATVPARDSSREIVVGLAALAAAGVAAYLLWRPSAAVAMPPQARPLVESIAALDADFAAGEVADEAYRRKRRLLKRQLRALLGAGVPEE
ncbi:MAG: hypothetical protein JW900_04795 [Anaerolineae bacterium]|nr:hypothetical protein [Anaerolineae bacterium]